MLEQILPLEITAADVSSHEDSIAKIFKIYALNSFLKNKINTICNTILRIVENRQFGELHYYK